MPNDSRSPGEKLEATITRRRPSAGVPSSATAWTVNSTISPAAIDEGTAWPINWTARTLLCIVTMAWVDTDSAVKERL